MNIAEELRSRGLVQQCSDEQAFASFKGAVYCGFDPTSDSLTVGNLLAMVTLRRFQKAGCTIIPLVGVATAMIGDPSGRNTERPQLDKAVLRQNALKIQAQIEKIVGVKPIWNSHFFEGGMNVPEFFRSVCPHFSVNEMLRRDSVKNRIENGGISFAELSYMVFQAYDFLRLFESKDCQAQIGGSDQWGNICSGLDLIKRKHPEANPLGITFPLLLKSDGTKFGKSSGGAVWLSAEKTSTWEFFNFWINQADADVERLLKFFSFKEIAEIESLVQSHKADPQKRLAQKALAEEITAIVHGKEAAARCQRIAAAMFENEWMALDEEDFEEVGRMVGSFEFLPGLIDVVKPLVDSGLVQSKSEARRLIEGGGIRLSGEVVGENPCLLPKYLFCNRFVVLQKGKKDFLIGSIKYSI